MLEPTDKELEEYSQSLEEMLVDQDNNLPLVSFSEKGTLCVGTV